MEYYIKDHLGNTRVIFSDLDNDGKIEVDPSSGNSELLSSTDYYPFGMAMEGSWDMQTSPQNDYLYNGKELDKELGLNLQHYGARLYDNVLGRFTGVDPISEQFAWVSTFNYAENEPTGAIDLHGLQKFETNFYDPNLNNASPAGKDAFYQGFVEAGAAITEAIIDEIPFIGEAKAFSEGDYTGVLLGVLPFGSIANRGRKFFKKTNNRSIGFQNEVDNSGFTEQEFSETIDALMSPHAKSGVAGVSINWSDDLNSHLVKKIDGIVDIHTHGDKTGSLLVIENGVETIVSKENIARRLKTEYPDAAAFRCLSCYGAKTAEAINKSTGKPALGVTGKITERSTGLSLPPGGSIIKYE